VHHAHVSTLASWVLPYPPGYVFPISFLAGGLRLLGIPTPTGLLSKPCGSLTVSYRAIADPVGVFTFRIAKLSSGWVASILRGCCGVPGWDFFLISTIDLFIENQSSPQTAVFPIVTGRSNLRSLVENFMCVYPSDVSLALVL
jgi:hypothetical protein